MTAEHLKQFFSERPQLSAFGFAKEAGISPRLMLYLLSGERSLTERTASKLLPVMVRYGYNVNCIAKDVKLFMNGRQVDYGTKLQTK